MTDRKISELTNITGANLADADEFPVVDTSADETKAITFGELKSAFDTSTGFVRITGDTMTGGLTVPTVDINGGTIDGTVIGGSTPAAGSFTTGSFTGNVSFGDNDKAIFGAGSDLQIYHDGAGGSSYITESGAGSLFIQGTNIRLQSEAGEQFFRGNANSSVELYYDNSERLATTSTGIDVTGTVTADGLTVDGGTIRKTGDGDQGQLRFTTVRDSYSTQWGAGQTPNTLDFELSHFNGTSWSNKLSVDANGDISFYEATGTTPKMVWKAADERLGIGTSSPSALIDARQTSTGGSTQIKVYNTDNSNTTTQTAALFLSPDSRGNGALIFAEKENADFSTSAGRDISLVFSPVLNNSQTERMRIDSSGNVGIGTSSPSALTHLSKNEITAYNGSATDGQLDIGSTMFIQQTGGSNNAIAQLVFQPRSGYGYNRIVSSGGSAPYMTFATNNSEAARLDASGNLLVGTTTTLTGADLIAGATGTYLGSDGFLKISRDNGNVFLVNRNTSDGSLVTFQKDGSTVGSIGVASSDNFYIGGTESNHGGILFNDTGGSQPAIQPCSVSGTLADNSVNIGSGGNRFKDLYLSGGLRGDTTFKNNAGTTEYARFDSSGNLLVGGTSSGAAQAVTISGTGGYVQARAASSATGFFDRLTSDGDIAVFRKDGATVGSIGTYGSRLLVGTGDTALQFNGTNAIWPSEADNSLNDGVVSLGVSNARFKDLYLSGGVTGGNATNPARFSHGKDDYITLADDTTLNLHASVAGSLIISVYDRVGGRGGVFHATFTGAVTQIAANGPWATSDTDGSYCVFKSTGSHAVYFKNRIGSSGTFQVSIFAAEC